MTMGRNFGEGYSPHLGILFISGLLFGPYGAAGAVLGNTICDLIRGYGLAITIIGEIVSLGVSILAYKLWYHQYKSRKILTKPKLNNTNQIIIFIGIILVCAMIYTLFIQKIFYIMEPNTDYLNFVVGMRYFINFVNSPFIFGIIGIRISEYIDFVHVPRTSTKKVNKNLYSAIAWVMIILTASILIIDKYTTKNTTVTIIESVIVLILLFLYIRKPITEKIIEIPYNTIPEKIMNIFLITTIFIIIIGYIIASDNVLTTALRNILPIELNEAILLVFLLMDILFMIFFIPTMAVLRYIESRVINSIVSFSEVEKFI